MQRLRGLVLVGMVLLTAPGCSDAGNGTTKKADGSLLAMLHSVPDTAENRAGLISYGNFARVRSGDTKGSADADFKMLFDRTSGSMSLPSMVQNGILQPEFAKYAGFDTRNIDASIEYGAAPDSVGVLVGNFDAGRVKKALQSSPGGDALRTSVAGDVQRFGIGDPNKIDPQDRSAIRRVGEAVELAVEGTSLVWSRNADKVEACLAARTATTSLAADVGYAAVASVLDGAAVTMGDLATPSAGESWLVAGIGEVRKGDGSVVTIALQYADATAAAAAVDAFTAHIKKDHSRRDGSAWSGLVKITDIRSVGPTMVATLSTTHSGLGRTALIAGDNLLQFG